jgi:DNA invertase Pin-like site-specific DNA recombinase
MAVGRGPTLDQLHAGDVLIVTRLDRPARSTATFSIPCGDHLQGSQGFRSLGDTWADTSTPNDAHRARGGLAEFWRELIRACTGERGERARRDACRNRP